MVKDQCPECGGYDDHGAAAHREEEERDHVCGCGLAEEVPDQEEVEGERS